MDLYILLKFSTNTVSQLRFYYSWATVNLHSVMSTHFMWPDKQKHICLNRQIKWGYIISYRNEGAAKGLVP